MLTLVIEFQVLFLRKKPKSKYEYNKERKRDFKVNKDEDRNKKVISFYSL